MKYLKTFETFEINEEIFGFGKSAEKKAYQRTIDFLEGNSPESKKVKELYEELKSSGKEDRDPQSLRIMQEISRIGNIWANKMKLDSKDYAFSQIKTVLEGDWSRFFKGGGGLSSGK